MSRVVLSTMILAGAGAIALFLNKETGKDNTPNPTVVNLGPVNGSNNSITSESTNTTGTTTPTEPKPPSTTILHIGKANPLELAESWRKKALKEPNFIRQLQKTLENTSADQKSRILAALVLGTLNDPKIDHILAHAFAVANDHELRRWIVYSLGADRSWMDTNVFDMFGRPWVVETPFGVALRVKRKVPENSLDPLLGALTDSEIQVRDAAVQSLRHSLNNSSVRAAFLSQVDDEPSDEAAADMAESLLDWGLRHGGDEAEAIAVHIMRLGISTKHDLLRFKIKDELAGMALSATQQNELIASLQLANSSDSILWIIELVDRHWDKLNNNLKLKATSSLTELLQHTNHKIREKSLRLLADQQYQIMEDKLIWHALNDKAWNVRLISISALETNAQKHQELFKQIIVTEKNEAVRKLTDSLIEK